jgi:lysophospholipase L1-like esterase
VAVAVVAALVLVMVPVGVSEFRVSADIPATFDTDPGLLVSTSASPETLPSTSESPSSEPAVGQTTGDAITTTALPVPKRPVSVLMLGDSTAAALADGFFRWSKDHPAQVRFASLAGLGCGTILDAVASGDVGGNYLKACKKAWTVDLPKLASRRAPDVVVVLVTLPDVGIRVWNSNEGELLPHDPRYTVRLAAALDARARALIAMGVRHILWVVPATPSGRWLGQLRPQFTDADWAVTTSAIADLAARYPQRIALARMDEWMALHEPADGSMRSDGLHLSAEGAYTISDQFFGPLAVAVGMR